jgi:hypothetical protein
MCEDEVMWRVSEPKRQEVTVAQKKSMKKYLIISALHQILLGLE